ncbi:efflux RND transporter periplasmic adaptor subunit [uncultured Roseobacter sp.]|uniref:efflux RND transporter periplasmic adaptor subunit n=1 Tax=uncultured Roseobacter sp. TaxID=114847 RepID=UPI00263672E3|nr:efflux RND transporter periplasmic adaptor subunit [uncultured Roseobacter sp.]
MTASSHTARSRLRSIIGQLGRLVLTLLVIALAIGLLVLGRGILGERAAAVEAPPATAPLEVAIARLQLQDHRSVTRRFPGQIEAAQRTTMAFEAGGTVAEMAVDEGSSVATGALIARLDTRLLEAEKTRLTANRRALEAQAELARRTTARQTELQERGFASNQAVDNVALQLTELEARIAEIDASRVAVDLQLEKSELRAPFAATIASRAVDTGSAVSPSQAIVSLVEAGPPQFRVGLSQDIIASLDADTVYTAQFGDRSFDVRLAAILPELDPTTRTRTLLLDFQTGELPPLRETGMLVLEQRIAERGAWVPLSALQDAPRGLWRLLTVPDGEAEAEAVEVGSEAVEVLFSDGARAFVRGTFEDSALYITDGPHRVVIGQTVRPVEAR